MSRRLLVRPEAEAEIAEAFDWYEERVIGLGEAFLLCLDAAFSAMMRNPLQFPRVHSGVRCVLMRRFPYEVFFVDNAEQIAVLSVFHAKRNPQRWRERA